MRVDYRDNSVFISAARDFDPVKIFDCGQCFRFVPDGDCITGVAFGRVLRVRAEQGGYNLLVPPEEYETVWRGFLDMERDYTAIRGALSARGPALERACAYGAGIRILRQDAWEATVSFIISQNSNIPRIRRSIETLCQAFGEPFEHGGRVYHAFPTARRLAALNLDDLKVVRAGYRDRYVLDAARMVACGALDLDGLRSLPQDEARAALKTITGVGEKVANCIMLFGLHRLDCFPVDVWIKRVLGAFDGQDLGAGSGGDAGIAQQYLFYAARAGELQISR